MNNIQIIDNTLKELLLEFDIRREVYDYVSVIRAFFIKKN